MAHRTQKAQIESLINKQRRLAEEFIPLLPSWPVQAIGLLLGDERAHVKLAFAREQIHVPRGQDLGLVPDLVANVHENDDGGGQIGLEEIDDEFAGRHVLPADGAEAGPELGAQHQGVEGEPNPGPDHADGGAERELVEPVALQRPRVPEPDVREADARPGEDRGEAGQRQHPVERVLLLVRRGEEAEQAEHRGEDDGVEGPAFAVDVCQEGRCLSLFGKRGERA